MALETIVTLSECVYSELISSQLKHPSIISIWFDLGRAVRHLPVLGPGHSCCVFAYVEDQKPNWKDCALAIVASNRVISNVLQSFVNVHVLW